MIAQSYKMFYQFMYRFLFVIVLLAVASGAVSVNRLFYSTDDCTGSLYYRFSTSIDFEANGCPTADEFKDRYLISCGVTGNLVLVGLTGFTSTCPPPNASNVTGFWIYPSMGECIPTPIGPPHKSFKYTISTAFTASPAPVASITALTDTGFYINSQEILYHYNICFLHIDVGIFNIIVIMNSLL